MKQNKRKHRMERSLRLACLLLAAGLSSGCGSVQKEMESLAKSLAEQEGIIIGSAEEDIASEDDRVSEKDIASGENIVSPDAGTAPENTESEEAPEDPAATRPTPEPLPLLPYEEIDFSKVFDWSDAGKPEDNPEYRMAHNIYSDPVLDETSGRFDGFLIDFKADHAPQATYWALCNWAMDTRCLLADHKSVGGGGAYCGLQNTWDGPTAIMSFWQIEADGEIITPSLLYPVKDGNGSFDNEGSGANYIASYPWEEGKWYRMYLKSYEEESIGHTCVEMWLKDLERGEWQKFCSYDTKLTGSCLIGNMSQFMENYYYTESTQVRSFQYANLCVRDFETKEWTRITESVLSIDTCFGNKKGTYAFGSTDTNLWGITCGYGPDAAPLNADIFATETIQPAGPEDAFMLRE